MGNDWVIKVNKSSLIHSFLYIKQFDKNIEARIWPEHFPKTTKNLSRRSILRMYLGQGSGENLRKYGLTLRTPEPWPKFIYFLIKEESMKKKFSIGKYEFQVISEQLNKKQEKIAKINTRSVIFYFFLNVAVLGSAREAFKSSAIKSFAQTRLFTRKNIFVYFQTSF